jgi:hypothetical protein
MREDNVGFVSVDCSLLEMGVAYEMGKQEAVASVAMNMGLEARWSFVTPYRELRVTVASDKLGSFLRALKTKGLDLSSHITMESVAGEEVRKLCAEYGIEVNGGTTAAPGP